MNFSGLANLRPYSTYLGAIYRRDSVTYLDTIERRNCISPVCKAGRLESLDSLVVNKVDGFINTLGFELLFVIDSYQVLRQEFIV